MDLTLKAGTALRLLCLPSLSLPASLQSSDAREARQDRRKPRSSSRTSRLSKIIPRFSLVRTKRDRRSTSIRIRSQSAGDGDTNTITTWRNTRIAWNVGPTFINEADRKDPTQLRRILPDQRGNVAMVVAAVFPLLIAGAGLAVDGVEWIMQKRQIQAAADGAAMAGVYGLIAAEDLDNTVNRSITQAGTVPNNASIQAVQGPAGRENDPFAVTSKSRFPRT